MQTQTQLPGQVPGCIPLQDRTSMPANTWSRTWQSDADVQLRRKVLERILQVFQMYRPNFPLEWQQKIPDLVKHVEEALYNDAASKEEYSDMLTLEQRLQIVAPRFIPSNAQQQRTANSVQDISRSSGPVSALLNNGSNMVPTPGMGSTMMPTPGFSTNMIPTPGNANGSVRTGSAMMPTPGLGSNKLSISGNTNMIPTPGGMGNFVANSGQTPTTMFSSGTMMPSPSSNNLLPHQGVNGMRLLQNGQLAASAGFSTGGMQMMPTPGLSMPQQPQSGTSSLGSTFPKVNDISVSQVQQQQFGAGSNGHMLRTHMNNNVQLKSAVNGGLVNGMLMNRQHLANGNVAVHDPTGYSSQTQFLLQQRMNQQRNMQMSNSLNSANGSYAMNAADLAGSGNLYAGAGLSTLGPQVPKLATSSQGQQQGIQPQQQQLQLQQNLQQQQGLQQQQQQQRPSLQAQQPQFQQLQQLQRSNFQQNGMSAQQPQEHGSLQLSDLVRENKQATELQNMPLGQLEQPTVEQQQSTKHAALEGGEQQAHENRQLKNITNEAHVAHQESQKPHLQLQTSAGTPQGDVLQSQNQQQNHGSMRMNQDLQMLEPQQVQLPSPQLAASVKQEQGSQLPAGSPQGAGQSDNAAAGPQSSVSSTRAQQYLKQQRWLLFLRHASKCNAVEGQCPCSPHCHTARQLLSHIAKCRDRDRECQYPRCSASIRLLTHHQQCRDARCPVCGPVRQVIIRQPSHPQADQVGGTVASPPGAASREFQPPMKRVKVEPSTENTSNDHDMEHGDALETGPVKVESQTSLKETKPCMKAEPQVQKQNLKAEPGSTVVNEMYDTKQPGPLVKHEQVRTPGSGVNVVAGQGGKPKLVGVSLTELFTPEQIRQHITSLRQWVGQSKTKAEKNQAMEHQINVNACGLCAVEKLYFEPPPIYCTSCGIRIKRNAPYYTTAIRETRHYFCIPCYNDVRTEMVELEGLTYPKASLEKRKHDEETEEAWVACDKCGLWQHQICALFNSRRNEGGEAEYTCPQCCMAEMEGGERKSLPPSAVLGAKDLPRTVLSDHLESRLAQKLRQERSERAKALGKSYDEVPGAEGLVVRVVSSVDKKLDVKQRFLEIFQEEDYPAEFPYKSKAVLLFQKIEGVEVCLYGMYVQEFGVECNQPNQRRIYLSYLDSVKYFRPEVKTLSGEALRTFVYHELLIAYLDYCKKRGFSSCYIWACPPLKGEDYILYCHPEIQKTPKSDKLREWYLTMLKKASRENIVVEVTNFYDYFFVSTGECKAKVTAARLPYFDGDYWPGAAEDMILQLQQEDDDGSKQQKKGKMKKPPTKRATKAAAQAEMAINASKDAQLMQKLGESIMPMKEDFIMVHMHHSCTHCRLFIVTGYRWVCKTCKNFQICERCYEAEIKLDERERHPINSKEMHLLTPVEVNDVPGDTKDKDEIMESEFFDTRHAFLSLCQGNHYQYDTLRRAKHSSMMVLYHLHNPMAPAFVTTCCICNHDIETGTGWRCETCPEHDVCNGCYQKEETRKHPHKLLPHPSASERNAQNTEARQQRVLQLRKMLDLLVHASQCGTLQCPYPNCCNLKRLFRHGMACPKRIAGGCILCKKMWYFMQLHARACKESQCRVPRCKDLKEHLRRLQHQMESRRRAAVMEMMRQRAAETAGRS